MIPWPEEITFIPSKYSRWYENIITRATVRGLERNKGITVEKHHIIPKSLGGTNIKQNLVYLLPREHYIAHALLWKMKFSGNANSKMIHAFNAMSIMNFKADRKIRYRINSHLFESIKKERRAYLKTRIGPLNPGFGKKPNISPEGRQRIKKAIQDNFADPIWRAKFIEINRLARLNPITQEKLKKKYTAVRGIARDPAIIEKGAAKRRGKKGLELFSEQALKNLREGFKRRVYSPEGRAAITEAARAANTGIVRIKKQCPHCKKMAANNTYARYHGDRCKLNPNFDK